jgi:hypothetical protein
MSLLKTNEIQNYNGSSLTLTASTVSTSAQLNTGGNISVTGSLNVSDDSTTRSNLGLGTMATQNANAVAITGGTISGVTAYPGRNRLINGSFQIAQRNTSFSGGTDNADDTYTLDRWYVLSEGNDSIDVTQQSDSPDSNGKSIRLDVETTGEKFGIAQIIEGRNCIGAIGNTCTLSFYAKASNARIDTVKAAIIAWSGTEDTVTSDIISAWNADGTTPTLIANATFENTPADLSVTASWARYELSANIDTASTKNIIIFIWSDDATNPQAGDFLYLTNIQFEAATSVATPFEHRPYGTELALCQRYYQYIDDNTTWLTGIAIGAVSTASSISTVRIPLYVPLRSSPSLNSINGAQIDADTYVTVTNITPSVYTESTINNLSLSFTGLNASLQDNRIAHFLPTTNLTFDAEL